MSARAFAVTRASSSGFSFVPGGNFVKCVTVRPSVDALSRVDMALAKVGKRRRVALLAPHFMVAPYLIPGTDMIACLAERLARHLAPEIGLTIAEPPVEIGRAHV